jgi:hypothetical protein
MCSLGAAVPSSSVALAAVCVATVGVSRSSGATWGGLHRAHSTGAPCCSSHHGCGGSNLPLLPSARRGQRSRWPTAHATLICAQSGCGHAACIMHLLATDVSDACRAARRTSAPSTTFTSWAHFLGSKAGATAAGSWRRCCSCVTSSRCPACWRQALMLPGGCMPAMASCRCAAAWLGSGWWD